MLRHLDWVEQVEPTNLLLQTSWSSHNTLYSTKSALLLLILLCRYNRQNVRLVCVRCVLKTFIRMPCGLQARPKETKRSLEVWDLRKGKRRLVKTEISEQPEALTNKPLYSQLWSFVYQHWCSWWLRLVIQTVELYIWYYTLLRVVWYMHANVSLVLISTSHLSEGVFVLIRKPRYTLWINITLLSPKYALLHKPDVTNISLREIRVRYKIPEHLP